MTARPPPQPTETIHLCPRLRAFARRGFGSPVTVVTFASYVDEPTLDRPGFGEAFLAHRGLDAVHVVCAGNDWYQYPETEAVLAAIRAFLPDGGTVVTYGESMGGYAAIAFAGALGAARAVAVSPQYSVDPRRVPWEKRWPQAAGLRFRHDPRMDRPVPCPVHLIYDDRNPDRLHAARIRRGAGAGHCVAVPFSGHPATGFLAETGLLSPLAHALILDRFDPPGFAARLAAAQARSPSYMLRLHRMLPWSPRLRRALLDRAYAIAWRMAEQDPECAGTDRWRVLARIAERRGDPMAAIDALRRYGRRHRYVWAQLDLARLLLRHGAASDLPEAIALLDEIDRLLPGHWKAGLSRALALVRLGQGRAALRRLRTMRRARPLALAPRLAAACLRCGANGAALARALDFAPGLAAHEAALRWVQALRFGRDAPARARAVLRAVPDRGGDAQRAWPSGWR